MTVIDRSFGYAVFYPETDGEPMAETDTHRELMTDLIFSLSEHFKDDPLTYVSGNLFLYYVEGEPRRSVSPDVFVVKGIEKKERPIYKLWEEGKAPDVVIELTSETTRLDDLGTKKGLYAVLGVKEYFIFDPFSEYLKPNLRGYRLSEDEYVPLQGNRIISDVLGLELTAEEGTLRLYETFSRKKLLTPVETARARDEAQKQLEIEREARMKAEEEIRRLKAMLDNTQ